MNFLLRIIAYLGKLWHRRVFWLSTITNFLYNHKFKPHRCPLRGFMKLHARAPSIRRGNPWNDKTLRTLTKQLMMKRYVLQLMICWT